LGYAAKARENAAARWPLVEDELEKKIAELEAKLVKENQNV